MKVIPAGNESDSLHSTLKEWVRTIQALPDPVRSALARRRVSLCHLVGLPQQFVASHVLIPLPMPDIVLHNKKNITNITNPLHLPSSAFHCEPCCHCPAQADPHYTGAKSPSQPCTVTSFPFPSSSLRAMFSHPCPGRPTLHGKYRIRSSGRAGITFTTQRLHATLHT
jgi:hypothetical protein